MKRYFRDVTFFIKKSVVLDDKNVIFFEKMSCSYMKPSNQCAVSFLHEQCANCPQQDQCKPKIFKKVAKIVTSKAAHERAKIQRNMNSKEFKNYARLRNGVETVPSNIRKNYHLEKIPRGKQRGKFFFGSKIVALNFRKLFNYVKLYNSISLKNQPMRRFCLPVTDSISMHHTPVDFGPVLSLIHIYRLAVHGGNNQYTDGARHAVFLRHGALARHRENSH